MARRMTLLRSTSRRMEGGGGHRPWSSEERADEDNKREDAFVKGSSLAIMLASESERRREGERERGMDMHTVEHRRLGEEEEEGGRGATCETSKPLKALFAVFSLSLSLSHSLPLSHTHTHTPLFSGSTSVRKRYQKRRRRKEGRGGGQQRVNGGTHAQAIRT